MTVSYITDEMRSLVGREFPEVVSFPVSASDIRRWAIATYWPETPPRIYWDPTAAETSRGPGIIAPLDFNPFAWMVATPEGLPLTATPDARIEGKLGATGPGLTRAMNGGIEMEFGEHRIRTGDVIISRARIVNYTERPGRLGLMLFTVIESIWTEQRGDWIKTVRLTHIRY